MIARVAFYPTLFYNVVLEKLGVTSWYSRIDDTVLLGALPFPSTATKLTEEENVRGVVTMNEEYETKLFSLTSEEWSSLDVQQLCLPTQDLVAAPEQSALHRGVDFIMAHRQRQHSVYVHCKAGRTRSATVVAAYLMTLHGIPPERAVELIKEKRPHVSIRAAQREALQEFYTTLSAGSG